VLQDQIGTGGFSLVFRAKSLRFGELFAAKIANTASTRQRSAATAALNEETALKLFNHPHIISLYESFHFESFSILILELCQVKSMFAILSEGERTSIPNLRPMIAQIIDAVCYIHSKHFVHRDIKPGNILLDGYGRPKIADFGLCIPWDETEPMTGVTGSHYYFSPEIFDRRPFDPYKADIWALGVTLYEMTTGLIKWQKDLRVVAESVRDGGILIGTETPKDIARTLRPMLQQQPDHRPQLEKVKAAMRFDGTLKAVSGQNLARFIGGRARADRRRRSSVEGPYAHITPMVKGQLTPLHLWLHL
jgi:serine/threonine protein kinase